MWTKIIANHTGQTFEYVFLDREIKVREASPQPPTNEEIQQYLEWARGDLDVMAMEEFEYKEQN